MAKEDVEVSPWKKIAGWLCVVAPMGIFWSACAMKATEDTESPGMADSAASTSADEAPVPMSPPLYGYPIHRPRPAPSPCWAVCGDDYDCLICCKCVRAGGRPSHCCR